MEKRLYQVTENAKKPILIYIDNTAILAWCVKHVNDTITKVCTLKKPEYLYLPCTLKVNDFND